MSMRLFALTVLVTAACTQRAPEQNAHIQQGGETSAKAAPAHRPEAPVFVRWQERSVDGGRLVLTAQIDIRTRIPAPIQVQVQVPPDAELVSGEPSFQLPPAEQATLIEREYVFNVKGQPAQDLVLVADAKTAAFGFHAKDAYRFGRPENVVRPSATGDDVRIGGKNIGPSVTVTPSK